MSEATLSAFPAKLQIFPKIFVTDFNRPPKWEETLARGNSGAARKTRLLLSKREAKGARLGARAAALALAPTSSTKATQPRRAGDRVQRSVLDGRALESLTPNPTRTSRENRGALRGPSERDGEDGYGRPPRGRGRQP